MSSSSGRLQPGSFFVIEAIVVSQVVEPPELDDNGKIMSSFLSHHRLREPGNRLRSAMPETATPHNREVRIGVDSGLSGRQVVMDEGIEEARAEAGSVESPALPRDEYGYASRPGGEVGRSCKMNCTRAMGSVERRAYGEQLERKYENW